jgi:hypothetical protein
MSADLKVGDRVTMRTVVSAVDSSSFKPSTGWHSRSLIVSNDGQNGTPIVAGEMVERVSSAIEAVANPDYDGDFSEENKRAMARAAIAAMRELDPVEVARLIGSDVEDIPEQAHFVMCWQGMIDAALSEDGK